MKPPVADFLFVTDTIPESVTGKRFIAPCGILPTVPTVSQITVTSAVPLSPISTFSIAEKIRLSDATLSPTEITLPGVPVIVAFTCDATPDFHVIPCSAAL